MKLEVGMYVRTKRGQIGKIMTISEYNVAIEFNNMWQDIINKENIVKASHTLLGNDKEPCLIEKGDYVNGMMVDSIGKTLVYHFYTNDVECAMFEKDIKSIVTKEQFENMSYKVGE